MLTSTWSLHLDLGLRALARHKPVDAVKSLQKALDQCPTSHGADLYRICFYLGVTLRRLGFPQTAIKSWMSCQRLNKRGPTRKLLARFTNCYGMDPQGSSESDDWQAFSSIQIARYFLFTNKRSFSTRAERDMIGDLVRDAWVEIRASGALAGMTSCAKLALFRGTRIVFPTKIVPESDTDGQVIAVNFQTQRKVKLDDRCSCGSGLFYYLCCGRTPAHEELLSGVF